MKLDLIFFLALFFSAFMTHSTDMDANTDIAIPLIQSSYETFIVDEEKFEHLILALRRYHSFDEYLVKMASAARHEPRTFLSLFKDDPATYICLPFAFSSLFFVSGFMGGGIDQSTPDALIAIKAVSAFCVWLVGVLLYLNIPVKHFRDLEMQGQDYVDKDAFIERINNIVVKDIKLLKISRVMEGYEIIVHSSIMNKLENLSLFSFIFKPVGQDLQ